MKRRRLLLAIVSALFATVALGGPSYADPKPDPPYPVNYNFLENSIMYGALPAAPGSNIWSCKPSKQHPRPVVLVHGTAGSAGGNWGTLSAVLANAGYCVFALTYGEVPPLTNSPVAVGGMNRLEKSAQELRTFVTKVRKATGARKVDLVGHSQGTLMPNYYVKFLHGDKYVRRYVSLSPVWKGEGVSNLPAQLITLGLAYGFDPSDVLPVVKFGPQILTGTPFMNKMRRGGSAVDGIDYTNIVTKYDEVILPYTSGIEAGMRNIVLQDRCARDFSEHVQIPSSPNVARLVLNALDPARAKPVKCRLVLPLNGFVLGGDAP